MTPLVTRAQAIAQSGTTLLFSEFKIYGEEYTLLASERVNAAPYNAINITVDAMYKENGDASSYKKSIWAFTNLSTGAILKSGVEITKGVETAVTISAMTDPSAKYGIYP